tara:strand:+ start:18644 stop:19267 length:624 start_codon:yes stop_codon:yes gene_type:complete
MKTHTIKNIFAAMILVATVASCSNDDDNVIVVGDDDGGMVTADFSGTFVQQDQMGRPGINTVLSGSTAIKNDFNVTIPSEQGAIFQPLFLDQAVALHAAFGASYETNILGLDATTLTTILASDVLQVAPNEPTSYFDGTNVLTGRNLNDDVIDISLILLFGGTTGDRFNGQDLDGDGVADLPILVTDNVSGDGETPSSSFPYLETPH